MDWHPGSQQASGNDAGNPIVDGEIDWTTIPLDFIFGQGMDFTTNPQVTHSNEFGPFDLNNFAASSTPYPFGNHALPYQNSFLQQDTINPAVLSQQYWPNSETDSISSSFDGHSSGFDKHPSTLSLGTYSTNSSSCSQTLEGDSTNASKPNKRRFCEQTMEDPAPSAPQIQLVNTRTVLGGEADQNAITIFESWLYDCPSIYPEDSEFNNLAALTRLDVEVVKAWFMKRLRAHRMDDCTFENWLDKYPSVYPGEEEFKSWAGLTKLSLDAVRLWFAQKLRCKASSMPRGNDHFSSGSQEIGVNVAFETALASQHQQQPSILQRAAAWVRDEKDTKCKATLDRSLLMRDNNKPFQCTLKCGKKFRTRDDLRRHEEVNWPQESWVCDLPATATVAGIRMCTQCETPNPSSDHIETHKKAACSDQPFPRGRLFHRKDHFSQHFRKVHPHVPCIDYERSSHFSVESNFPRRCGFCTHRFVNWKERVEHIGVHFLDEGKDMTQWNDHSEAEDESENSDDKHDDDEDRDPGDASDSSDDDADDSPPPSAPKKRVQARAARSGGQSSTIAPGSSSWMLHPSHDSLELDVRTSKTVKNEDDPHNMSNGDVSIQKGGEASHEGDVEKDHLKNNSLGIVVPPQAPQEEQSIPIRSLRDQNILPSSLQPILRRSSLPYRPRPRPSLRYDIQPTSPADHVPNYFVISEDSRYVPTTNPQLTPEDSGVHQLSPRSKHSDGNGPIQKSKEGVAFFTWDIYQFTTATIAVVIALFVISCFELLLLDTKGSTYRVQQIDKAWRFIVGFGAIPSFLALCYRRSVRLTPPNESMVGKAYNPPRTWLVASSPKQTRSLKINQTTGCIRSLLFLSFTLFITFFSVLTSYYLQAATKMSILSMPVTSVEPSSISLGGNSLNGAAEATIGTYFSTAASGALETKVVYNNGNGQICIRKKSQNKWSNAQCLDGANPRADTPLTVLDWLGGPSIYFITADNYLSGIDHIPANDTWKFSSLRDQKRPTHPWSQLSSVTWFNGSSSWLYYQDINSQLREFGLDDYQDTVWRDGSKGPLGLALTGTGIETSRWWLSDGSEVLEVFVQVCGSIDHVPTSDRWQFSPVRSTTRLKHPQSQLSSATWLNGTWSRLFYYQDANNQLREFSFYDYRDIVRRYGSIGTLDLTLPGALNLTSRGWWQADGNEALEVHFMVSNDILHGRAYMESAWYSAHASAISTSNTTLVTSIPSATSAASETSPTPWTNDNAERSFTENSSTSDTVLEAERAYSKRNMDRIALSGSTKSYFIGNNIQWCNALFQSYVTPYYSESATFNYSQSSNKDDNILLQDTALDKLPQCLVFRQEMIDTGNDTFISDLSHEAMREDVSKQYANTGSDIQRHSVQSPASSRNATRTPNCTLFRLILLPIVLQTFFLAYIVWISASFRLFIRRKTLSGLELMSIAASILCWVPAITFLDDQDIIAFTVVVYMVPVTFRLLRWIAEALGKYRTWRTLALYLIVMASPTLAALDSTGIAVWALPALVLCLIVRSTHNCYSYGAIAQDYKMRKTRNSPSWTTIYNICHVIVHLLGDPIGSIWNLVNRRRILASTKTINASSGAMFDAQPRFFYDQLWNDEKKSKNGQKGDVDSCIILLTLSEVESVLDMRARSNLFAASTICWWLFDLPYFGIDYVVSKMTRKLNLFFCKPSSSKFSWVQYWLPITRSISSTLGLVLSITLGNQSHWDYCLLLPAITIPFILLDEHIPAQIPAFLGAMAIIRIEFLLVLGLIKWCDNSSVPVFSIGEEYLRQREIGETQSSFKGRHSSGSDAAAAGWNIDPVTDVGAWAEGMRAADGYPWTLSHMDLSVDENYGS